MTTAPRTALLLLNLGTPDAPTTVAVHAYLKEFLSDPRVVSLNPIGRWALLNLVILFTRPQQSAAAYREIWTDDGSPLLVASKKLARDIQALLEKEADEPVQVELAMRYGNPSLPAALARLEKAGIDRIVVFPLYPQYASATTGSSVERVMELAGAMWTLPSMHFVAPFYDRPEFLDAQSESTQAGLEEFAPDHVLFSFHGVPQDHVTRGEAGKHCLQRDDCCANIGAENRLCYRAHCYATARGLAQRLGLSADKYTVSFQSRLGRAEWLRPYTDDVVVDLAKNGVKRLAMYSPAFITDCLETLEELGIRAKEDFEQAGGDAFWLAPCVNAHPAWVRGATTLAAESGWIQIGRASPGE